MRNLVLQQKKIFAWSALTAAMFVSTTATVPFIFSGQAASVCPPLSAGTLFKVTNNSAVYLINDNRERLYFPNSEVYHSWYDDFSAIVEIAETCVDNYPVPTQAPYGVNYRPGSRLVKVKISPSVYVIEAGHRLAKLESEQVAQDLYGRNWSNLVRDIPDAFWPNYPERANNIATSTPHDGMLIKQVGQRAVYSVCGHELCRVDGPLSPAATQDVREVAESVFDRLNISPRMVEADSITANLSQRVIRPRPAITAPPALPITATTTASIMAPTTTPSIIATTTPSTINPIPSATTTNPTPSIVPTTPPATTAQPSTTSPPAASGSTTSTASTTATSTTTTSTTATSTNSGTSTSTQTVAPAVPPVISFQYITNVTTDSVTVTWSTNENSNGALLISTDAAANFTNLSPAATHSDMTFGHTLTAANLTPNTLYYYVVKSSNAQGAEATSLINSFTTWSAWSAASLIGHWKFDGGPYNEIAGGPAAVTVGNAIFYTSGGAAGGYAYIPTGADSVKIPYQPSFDLPNSFTVEFWFRQRLDQSFSQNLIYKGYGMNTYNFSIFRQLWNQYNHGSIISGYTAQNSGYWSQTSNPNNLAHSVWHHVVFTKYPTGSSYYLDGSLIHALNTTYIHSADYAGSAKTPATDIVIGDTAVDTDIDELKIYNQPFSLAQVQAAFGSFTPSTETGTIASSTGNSTTTGWLTGNDRLVWKDKNPLLRLAGGLYLILKSFFITATKAISNF